MGKTPHASRQVYRRMGYAAWSLLALWLMFLAFSNGGLRALTVALFFVHLSIVLFVSRPHVKP
jgi:hypothetical protein